MNDKVAPKIEFPCANYQVKVIGNKVDDFIDKVHNIALIHDNELDCSLSEFKITEKGNYAVLRIFMKATSIEQLQNLNNDLRELDFVQMVL